MKNAHYFLYHPLLHFMECTSFDWEMHGTSIGINNVKKYIDNRTAVELNNVDGLCNINILFISHWRLINFTAHILYRKYISYRSNVSSLYFIGTMWHPTNPRPDHTCGFSARVMVWKNQKKLLNEHVFRLIEIFLKK